jgi:hypothetical protein
MRDNGAPGIHCLEVQTRIEEALAFIDEWAMESCHWNRNLFNLLILRAIDDRCQETIYA